MGGGVMTALISKTPPSRPSQQVSTAEDNQSAVTIHVLKRVSVNARLITKSLSGSVQPGWVLTGAARRTQIEVTFDIDADSIPARLRERQKQQLEQKITIKASPV